MKSKQDFIFWYYQKFFAPKSYFCPISYLPSLTRFFFYHLPVLTLQSDDCLSEHTLLHSHHLSDLILFSKEFILLWGWACVARDGSILCIWRIDGCYLGIQRAEDKRIEVESMHARITGERLTIIKWKRKPIDPYLAIHSFSQLRENMDDALLTQVRISSEDVSAKTWVSASLKITDRLTQLETAQVINL